MPSALEARAFKAAEVQTAAEDLYSALSELVRVQDHGRCSQMLRIVTHRGPPGGSIGD